MTKREQLKAVADGFFQLGTNAHAEGMAHIQTAARLEQIAKMCDEAMASEAMRVLVEQGLVEVVGGELVVSKQERETDPKLS